MTHNKLYFTDAIYWLGCKLSHFCRMTQIQYTENCKCSQGANFVMSDYYTEYEW